jgi:hypothetical protein
MKMVAENPGNISGWLTDNNGRLRVAVATDGVATTLLYRQTEEGSFRPIVTTDFKDSIDPLYFTFDNQHLFVASNIGRDKRRFSNTTLKQASILSSFMIIRKRSAA